MSFFLKVLEIVCDNTNLGPDAEKDFAFQVFCFFFFAAGNNMLFSMSLYPALLGYKFKSVGSSPTRCW